MIIILDVKKVLKDIIIRLDLIDDYIVESGEYAVASNIKYTWDKYASGKLVIKLKIASTYTAKTSSGYGYYTTQSVTIDSNVPLIDGTIEDVEVHSIGGNGLFSFPVKSISDRAFAYFAWCSANITTAISKTIMHTITGRWK